MLPTETEAEPEGGQEQLDALTSLVRRLIVAARTGPHGPGTRREGHRQANCDSCYAIAEGRRFVAAMNGEQVPDTVTVEDDPERLVVVPS